MSGGLDERLVALAAAVDVAEARLDAEPVAAARNVVDRAGARIGLGVGTTVAALAGPTGAGKSSLFNALAGGELTRVSRLRPTTGSATAATWGDAAQPLLDWLGVGTRHHVSHDRLDDVVLLDLPDFDSVAAAHRLEVDRLIELVDLVVWVVDPQKYADAALHENYLRPLVAYERSMAVVLNQVDLLSADAREACLADLRRLLVEDGLARVPLLALSARTGDGVDALRALLAERAAARGAAVTRLAADVDVAAGALAPFCGDGRARGVGREERARLVAALAAAAGVPSVAAAVGASHRRSGALATGWPFLRWLRRLRPDPLRRLRVGGGDERVRTSLPGPNAVQRAQAETAARELAAAAASALPDPWPTLVRQAAVESEERVADALDRAVAGAPLNVRPPRWWRAVGALQALLGAAALVGALWLLALAVLGWLRIDDVVPLPEIYDVPLPTALLLGGMLGGVVLAFLARLVNGASARRRARAARRALARRVEDVAQELVVAPVERELAAHDALRAAIERAR